MRSSFVLISLAALLTACPSEAPPAGGETAADPLKGARAEAAEAGKSLLVLLTKEGCGCSEQMDEVLAGDEVKQALEKMIFARVTLGKDSQAFEAEYPGAKAPAFVVLSPDGKARGEVLNGPFEAGEFLFLLDWVAQGEGPQPKIEAIKDACPGTCEDHEED